VVDDDLGVNYLKTTWFIGMIIPFIVWLLWRVILPRRWQAREEAKLARAIVVHYNGK
jgi:hypothetical protein